MGEKKYFWLRLQHDFFQSKRIKKLRKLAGGDTYTIIYLKMQLKAIMNDGVLTYTGIEPTFAEELALDIDEEPDNVLVTINYLLSCGLMESSDGNEFLLPYAVENTGSETSGAKRVREFRDRQKALHCNASVTQLKQNCNGEKEIEKKKEIESYSEREFPTLEKVTAFASERKSPVDPKRFFSYYNESGWKDAHGNPVRNWKQKFISWENSEVSRNKPAKVQEWDDDKANEQLDRLLKKMEGNNA